MAVTVRADNASRSPSSSSSSSATAGYARLSYTLELLVDLDVSFGPFETKILDTGVKATPHTACVLFCTKISSASSAPHAVDFAAVGPNEREADPQSEKGYRDSGILVQVSNPSIKTLPPQEIPLRLILFALPLAPVRLEVLWIQKKTEDPRHKTKFPISILSVTPGVHSLDVQLAASSLCWKAFPRQRRLTTMISLDMFKADIRRYTIAEIKSCTQKGVYVYEVTTTQTTGNAYITLVTREDDPVPPSSLVLRIVFREEETAETTGDANPPSATTSYQRWIAFDTSPDPTFCIPHDHGIAITCPKDVHLFPDLPNRLDIALSFCSERAHLGLFIPAPREDVNCQIVAWREKQRLSLTLTSPNSTDLRRGDLLGNAYFLPSDAIRVRKVAPLPAPPTTNRYTALLTNQTTNGGQQRRTTSDRIRSTTRKNILTSGERDFWTGFPPSEIRRKRTHTGTLCSDCPISYPTAPTSAIDAADTERDECFPDEDDTLEIYPCGTIFKLKHLIPLVLDERRDGRRDGDDGPRRPPKKIATVTSLRMRGRWTSKRKTDPSPRLAWSHYPDTEQNPEL